ncbi:IS4 family transposase [Limibacter armeniacum]|uniref:IS4 family transposase n=1 Tax=Limibacter armeniacum TaxID=466084 RepID=UPI002FE5BC6A
MLTANILEILCGFQIVKGKPSKQVLAKLITALVEDENVQFHQIAKNLPSKAQKASRTKQVKRFMSGAVFNYQALMAWLFSCLPSGKITLCIDRTNWQSRKQAVNILAVTAYSHGVGFPLAFRLLDKKGNSHQQERIDLLKEVLQIVPPERIGKVIADREFIGKKWLRFMTMQGIVFCVRIPSHHKINIDGVEKTGEVWSKEGFRCTDRRATIYGMDLTLSMQMTKDKNGRKDYLIVVSNLMKRGLLSSYRKRWSIEVFFQSLKGRGFNLEATHLTKLDRLERLFAVVCMAFAVCHLFGVAFHEKVQNIKVKNHGYRENSYFRKGKDLLQEHFCTRPRQVGNEIKGLWKKFWRGISPKTPSEKLVFSWL